MGQEFVLDEPEEFDDAIAALLRVDPSSTADGPRAETVVCQLCGLVIRDTDHVIAAESFVPPVVHVGCAERAHLPPGEWEHTDIRTLNQWMRSAGWAGSG